MSAVEKRSSSHTLKPAAEGRGMSTTVDICVAMAIALAVYLLGSALVWQDPMPGAERRAGQAEMSFQGP